MKNQNQIEPRTSTRREQVGIHGLSRLVSVVLLAFVLAACGSKLTNENLTTVKHGMSEQEVIQILGKPNRVETGEILGLRGTTYYYEKGKNKVTINFINDQVSAKNGKFEN